MTSYPVEFLPSAERAFLVQLQRQALQYFLDNQADNGLILDRQSNHGRRREDGLCSTAATGMGLIALALASAAPHRLLERSAAIQRILACLHGVLEALPHEEGVVPHFVDARTGAVRGFDAFSTVDTAWLVVGALWSAAFLGDDELACLASEIYGRVHWSYWTAPDCSESSGLLRHGKAQDGSFLPCCWDRLNGETIFLYVLAAGAEPGRELPAASWSALRSFHGELAGLRFNNADLGLFVFQYGLDLLDLSAWQEPGGMDLATEASVATAANFQACTALADTYATYRRHWGLSAGDGPGCPPESSTYRCYSPSGPIDGTAHLTAALASVAHAPGEVLANLHEAAPAAHGRYGFSNVNLDHDWIGGDMVGIDAGAAVLALDNYLAADRVRAVCHELPSIRRGLQRLGFTLRQPVRLAS